MISEGSCDTRQGHVQVHTGAQRFAIVSGLNDMFPLKRVQRGVGYVFSCLVGVVKNVSPISSNMNINRAGIKETAGTVDPVKSL